MTRAWPSDLVLALRDDLEVRRTGDRRKPAVLEDPTFRKRYTLDDAGARVVRAIDGQRTVAEVLRRANLGSRRRVPRALFEEVLGFLEDASLLQRPGQAAHAPPPSVPVGTVTVRAEEVRTLDVEVLPGARFSCQGTGMCCGGYTYGPVTDAEAARVEHHAFAGDPEALRGERFTWTVGPDGRRIRVLATHDDVCVFLDDDRRCRIHAELGADAKPSFCRTYPFLFTATPDRRVRVSLNMECGGMARARFGAPVQDRAAELLALAKSVQLERLDEHVVLAPGHPVPWSGYRRLERAWLDGLDDTEASATGLVRRLATQLTRFADGGSPDDVPAAAGAPLLPDETVATPVLEVLLAWASAVASEALDEGSILRAELHMRVRLAIGLLLRRPEVVGDLWPEATAHLDALPGTRADDAATELIRLHLRNAVFGGWPLRTSTVAVGLGWLAVKVAVIGGLAPIVAAHARRATLDDAVVVEAIRTTNRALRPSVLQTCFAEDERPLSAWAAALAAG